jgi:hypothetical protein
MSNQVNRINYKHFAVISNEYSAVLQFWRDYSKKYNFEDNRARPNVTIKHAFFVACREVTGFAYSAIGDVINKDHATVLHACRNHESNIHFLPSYHKIYNEIKNNLQSLLDKGEIRRDVDEIFELNVLRSRLIETSSKLRRKIVEYNNLKDEIGGLESPHRIKIENDFLKKNSKEIHDRNKKLQEELKRVKNLI